MSYHTHTHKGKQQKYIIAVHKFRHIIFYTLYILQFLWAVSSGCTASFFQVSMKKKEPEPCTQQSLRYSQLWSHRHWCWSNALSSAWNIFQGIIPKYDSCSKHASRLSPAPQHLALPTTELDKLEKASANVTDNAHIAQLSPGTPLPHPKQCKKKQLLQFRAGQIPTDYTKVLFHVRFTKEHNNGRSDPRHGTGHSSLPPAILVHSHWQPWGCCLQLWLKGCQGTRCLPHHWTPPSNTQLLKS